MEQDGSFSDSRKVVAVAAGEAHTLALTADGCVYSWGRGMFGRLGTGSEKDELFPVPVNFETCSGSSPEGNKLKFVGVAAGAYHSLALADDGSVWSWGYNVYHELKRIRVKFFFSLAGPYHQLGVKRENLEVPHFMSQFLELSSPQSLKDESKTKSKTTLKICSVKAGGMMSLAIDNLGALWMWGNCPQQNGSNDSGFNLMSSSTPIPVWDFHGHVVLKVACGNEHVVALVTAGETYEGEDLVCFSWGNNSHGQLGLGDREARLRPEVVETFNKDSSRAIYDVACGAFHTALLARKKRPNDKLSSTCWTFGLGENGQLGHGTTQSALKPKRVEELPQYVYLVSVDCGLFHTSVVSSAGDVWSWGMEKGLGLCPDASFSGSDSGDAIYPLLISGDGMYGPKFHEPVQVACGAAHTVLVANEGYKLWSWGRGRSGVLGNGKASDCFTPTLVLWPPLTEDFKQEESNRVTEQDDKPGDKGSDTSAETDKRLLQAMEELKLLQSKFSTMEQYAGILHGSIFGKPFTEQDIPTSLQTSGNFDIAREWDNMLESADHRNLVRLELFYRNMLAGVKDKIMKRRVQELIKECLHDQPDQRNAPK